MHGRYDILRIKYLDRSTRLPPDSLLATITQFTTTHRPSPRITSSPWYKLLKHPLWQQRLATDDPPRLTPYLRQLLDSILAMEQQSSILLKQCRSTRGIDLIMRPPMLRTHRSRLIRWRLGWMTGGIPKSYACGQALSKQHIIQCFNLHSRLSVSNDHPDPLSHVLNQFPTRPRSKTIIKKWRKYWPIITTILLALELLQHPHHIERPTQPDDPFLTWLAKAELQSKP
ncbi:hypothetical protein BC941DRAFT_364235 [Chlamydoabsidia padenii]|nr:hypothetical protein BC941DRAFT_364235 [Chlamydoabsidia padenii]